MKKTETKKETVKKPKAASLTLSLVPNKMMRATLSCKTVQERIARVMLDKANETTAGLPGALVNSELFEAAVAWWEGGKESGAYPLFQALSDSVPGLVAMPVDTADGEDTAVIVALPDDFFPVDMWLAMFLMKEQGIHKGYSLYRSRQAVKVGQGRFGVLNRNYHVVRFTDKKMDDAWTKVNPVFTISPEALKH